MRDLDYDVDRALGIPARRPAALLCADVDEALGVGQADTFVQALRGMSQEIEAQRPALLQKLAEARLAQPEPVEVLLMRQMLDELRELRHEVSRLRISHQDMARANALMCLHN